MKKLLVSALFIFASLTGCGDSKSDSADDSSKNMLVGQISGKKFKILEGVPAENTDQTLKAAAGKDLKVLFEKPLDGVKSSHNFSLKFSPLTLNSYH